MTLKELASVQGNFSQRVFTSTGFDIDEFYEKIRIKQTSKIVQVSIHNSCPQSCGHCFQLETKPKKKHFIRKRVTEIFGKFDSGTFRKYPFPREPLLIPDLFPVYKDLNCTEISTTTLSLTNHADLIDEMKKYNIRTAFVSLHGDREQHSQLTNSDPDRYDKIIRNIKQLIHSGIDVEIVTTLYKHNMNALEYLPEVLVQIGVSRWWVQRIMPTGRAVSWKLSDFIYGDECNSVMIKFAEIRSKYRPEKLHVGLDLTWGPNFYSTKMLRYLSGQENRWPWSRYVCPAVSGDSMTVSFESGFIYPCLFFETFPEAQIAQEKEMAFQTLFSEKSLMENLQGQCKNCSYKPFCLGGCRAVAFSFAKLQGLDNPLFAGQDYCLTRELDKEFGCV